MVCDVHVWVSLSCLTVLLLWLRQEFNFYISVAYLYADNQGKTLCKNMDISDDATCRTLACRCYNFQSEFCVGFQSFLEANVPLLYLPFHVIPPSLGYSS
jgi:hypothetical protein